MSPAIDALKGLGATDPVQPDHRGSFAFAGYAGANKPQWITQRRADKGQGPSEIFPKIALSAGVFGYQLVIDLYTGPLFVCRAREWVRVALVATERNPLKPLESSSNFLVLNILTKAQLILEPAFLYHMYACHAFVQPQRISASVLNETFEALSSNCI